MSMILSGSVNFFGIPHGKFVWDLNPSCRSLGILSPQSFDRWLMGNDGRLMTNMGFIAINDGKYHRSIQKSSNKFLHVDMIIGIHWIYIYILLLLLLLSLLLYIYMYNSNRWLHGHSQNILVIVGLNPSPVIIDCHEMSCGLMC